MTFNVYLQHSFVEVYKQTIFDARLEHTLSAFVEYLKCVIERSFVPICILRGRYMTLFVLSYE